MATVGIINQGFTTPTTMMIPSNESPICKQSINALVKSSSTDPISLENLFRILPALFVLKNRMVALMMLMNIVSCRFVEALMHTEKKVKDRTKVTIIKSAIITEYM